MRVCPVGFIMYDKINRQIFKSRTDLLDTNKKAVLFLLMVYSVED